MSEITIYKGSPSGEIVQDRRSLPRPTGSYVLVRVTHSGICGSDQHFLHRDMVLGHEGAGMVEGVGDRVRELKVYVSFLPSLSLSYSFFEDCS